MPKAVRGNATHMALWRTKNKDELNLIAKEFSGEVDVKKFMEVYEWIMSDEEDRLRGSIPPELGVLRGLTHLDLSGNELDGPVPVALVTASSLEHMDISGNSLDWSTVGRQGPRRGASDGEL